MQLNTRISLTLFVFSAVVALVVGGVGHVANEKIEEEIWLQMLNSELEFQVRRAGQKDFGSSENLPQTILYYGDPLKTLDSVPPALRSLKTGLHDELEFDGAQVCILVKDIGPNRYFLVFDITKLEEAEHKADLVAILTILLVIGLVVWSSVYLGRWLTQPIHDLARRVGTFTPSDQHQPIADNYSDQEVRKIAEAIDGFFERLTLFIKRERKFVSMASHEFRTPLAVISGAGDVISALPDLPKNVIKPLTRIQRTANDMNEMISVLLSLVKEDFSKGDAGESEKLDIILFHTIDNHKQLLEGKDVTLECGEIESTIVAAPQALLRVLVSNLLRNALQHMVSGTVSVSLRNRELLIKDTGPGVPADILSKINEAKSSNDFISSTGLGLYIVSRIVEAYGWNFSLSDREEVGAIASVVFNDR